MIWSMNIVLYTYIPRKALDYLKMEADTRHNDNVSFFCLLRLWNMYYGGIFYIMQFGQ